MRERISPWRLRPTASGLMIANVRSMATNDSSRIEDAGLRPGATKSENSGELALQLPSLQCRGHSGAEVRGRFDAANAGSTHGRVLILRGALAAADDGAGMTHAAARGRGLAGDEADDGLFHVDFDPLRRGLFRVAADFANHDDGIGFRISVEELNGVKERRANDGVAANADTSGLADAEPSQLVDGFVGECAAAANDADVALLMDAAGHDADFAFSRC